MQNAETNKGDNTMNEAQEKFSSTTAEALALITRIANKIEMMNKDQSRKDWGDVGEAQWAKSELQEMADRLFCEGEYAE